MNHRPKPSKPQKRALKVPGKRWGDSSKKCSVKWAAPSPTPQSTRPNISTRFGSPNASPAKRRKQNGYGHPGGWSGRGQGKHKQGNQRQKLRHPNPNSLLCRHRVENQTVRTQEKPQQDTQPAIGLDISSRRWLWYGAYIGNETRNIEFKQGKGNYMEVVFRDHILKYGCAFLNSGGGTLLVGICDSGMVCGVYLDHEREDNARLQVDSTAQKFHPPLLPHNYSLRFVPVIQPGVTGQQLKVVCLTFTAPPVSSQPTLYQVEKGEVYLRRDGSVQGPVGAPVIIEWFTQMWARKMQQLEQSACEMMLEKRSLTGQVEMLLKVIALLQSEKKISASGGHKGKKRDQESKSTSQHFPFCSLDSGYRVISPDHSSGSDSST